jgi:dihydrodipicolinate synthase/N-acetylneuraminate lyase
VLKLSPAERRELTDVIVDEVAGAVPVFVGAGAPSVRDSIELARHAEAAGASCVVLPAPMGGALGPSALVDYFLRIASAVALPVMIQDAPAHLGVGLGPEVVHQVGRAAENVRLVKLEAGPVEMSGWIERLGPEFAIWGGDGGAYLLDCVRTGAAGIIPGGDLVDLLVRVYEAETAGETALAEERFREILPTLVFEIQHSIDHYNACAKRVLVRRGVLTDARLRAPATALSQGSRTLLERHLVALKLETDGARVG